MHFVNRQPQVEILRVSKSSDMSPLITEEGGGIQPLYVYLIVVVTQRKVELEAGTASAAPKRLPPTAD